MNAANKKNALVADLVANFGTTVNRAQIMSAASKYDINPGFLTINKIGRGIYDISSFVSDVAGVSNIEAKVEKTDEELVDSQRRRFRTLDRMIAGVIAGRVRSMIVSGPAGIGKTYTAEGMLESAADDSKITYQKISGFVKATGLFKAFWNNRHDNSVILIDDADSAFGDEVALNLLKTALDSGKRRMITWGSEKIFMDEVGEEIPSTFEFRGSVIFITNLNFENLIAQGKNLAPHFQALISRSFYIDLNFDSSREYILRIEDVLRNTDMAYSCGLDEKNVEFLISYIKDNMPRLRELSLRMVLKMAQILSFADSTDDFMEVASATCLRRR